MKEPVNIFWFRRDLRLKDNVGFSKALKGSYPVMPIFIFDKSILDELPEDDARVTFIYETLQSMRKTLRDEHNSSIAFYYGTPEEAFKSILSDYDIKNVITNRDYEPYASERDEKIQKLLDENEIGFYTFKDQVIFEKDEVAKQDGDPYKVYTPYMRRWKKNLSEDELRPHRNSYKNLVQNKRLPQLGMDDIGFKKSKLQVPDYDVGASLIKSYNETRDLPAKQSTSRLGPHLRFGTVSIRKVMKRASEVVDDETFWEELIWREFFMQVLWHNPRSVTENFKEKYDGIEWRNDEEDFEKWKAGKTGFPLVDAGMRQLSESGYMHNRVRLVVGSFLCKDLLIDWRWGESWFAERLLDYEMSSNIGNWQWIAGTGTDAAPYFRIFNPETQREKYDPDFEYIKKWVDEFGTGEYPDKMLNHKDARERCLKVYKAGINSEGYD